MRPAQRLPTLIVRALACCQNMALLDGYRELTRLRWETRRCIIGKDYPAPIVDHAVVHKTNISRMAEAYKCVTAQMKRSRFQAAA